VAADAFDRIQALLTEAQAFGDQLNRSLGSDASYEARDADGVAVAVVDGRGRPVDLLLQPDWQQMTDLSGLQDAIVAAFSAAGEARLISWGEALTDDDPKAAAAQPPPAPPAGAAGHALPGIDGTALIRSMLDLVGRAAEQVDEVRERAAARLGAEVVTPSSPSSPVRVHAVAGAVTGVEINVRWVRAASVRQLAQEVLTTLQAAYDRAWDDTDLPAELASLQRLTSDPAQLLRQVGL
jgi:hypothetical protein